MAELTYNILYITTSGDIKQVSSETLTAGADESVLTGQTIPADFETDLYVITNGVLTKRASSLVIQDDINVRVKNAVFAAYRAEIEIVRPRLWSLVGGDTDLETIYWAYMNARWQAMRNLYQAQTLHIGGTATAVTNTLRLVAAASLPAGATDAHSAETIAAHLADGVTAPTLATLFIDATGTQTNFAGAVTFGRLDATYKVFHLEWLNDNPGTVTAITDTP